MKKLFCTLLVLALLFSFSGCKGNTPKENAQSAIASSSEKEPVSETETTPDYNDIVCRSSSEIKWHALRFKDNFSGTSIELSFPTDWSIQESDVETYNIVRSGKNIGTVTTSHVPAAKEKFEYSEKENDDKLIESSRQINYYQKDGQDSFRRIFSFESDQNDSDFELFVMVDYAELDNQAADKLYDSVSTAKAYVNTTFTPLSKSNGSKRILVLGNSFVGTSRIGEFLNDMFTSSGSGYSADAMSIAYADVGTHIANSEICNTIRLGQYSYVFMCGFYSMQSVEDTATMEKICKESNTQLVLFPAHNENSSAVYAAKTKYTNLTFVDWQGQIESLIDSGVAWSELCINDDHKHSTPLAGYVGAHMIYCGLFGKVPPEITNSSPLSMGKVRSLLGGFVDKNSIPAQAASFSGKTYEIG